MSYSRHSSSTWYTFWAAPEGVQNRDNARFEICPLTSFSAAELRSDIDACLSRVADLVRSEQGTLINRPVTPDELQELRGYMLHFLQDVDDRYPLTGGTP